MKGFSPRARAEIEDPFAGFRGDEAGDELGGFVLNPDQPVLVGGRLP